MTQESAYNDAKQLYASELNEIKQPCQRLTNTFQREYCEEHIDRIVKIFFKSGYKNGLVDAAVIAMSERR